MWRVFGSMVDSVFAMSRIILHLLCVNCRIYFPVLWSYCSSFVYALSSEMVVLGIPQTSLTLLQTSICLSTKASAKWLNVKCKYECACVDKWLVLSGRTSSTQKERITVMTDQYCGLLVSCNLQNNSYKLWVNCCLTRHLSHYQSCTE